MIVSLGETFSTRYEIRDADGELGDAGTFTIDVYLPDGTAVTATASQPDIGIYDVDYLTTVSGPHVMVATATGGVLGAVVKKFPDTFVVRTIRADALLSLADAKAHLNIPQAITRDDDELEAFIRAVGGLIEGRVGPVVPRTVVERHYGPGPVILRQWPVVELTSVITPDGTSSLDPADLSVDEAGVVRYTADWCIPLPIGPYDWTYVAGRTDVPEEIILAAKMLLAEMWATQRGAGGGNAGARNLPLATSEDPTQGDGMGLVMWRVEQMLANHLLPPKVA